MKAIYREPVFYFDGDNSAFVEATHIASEGIYVPKSLELKTRLKKFKIEFSFPNSEVVIKATAELDKAGQSLFLKFTSIDKKSIGIIQNYISKNSKKSASRQAEINQ